MDVPRVRLFCIGFSGRDRFALTEPVPLTFVDLRPAERNKVELIETAESAKVANSSTGF